MSRFFFIVSRNCFGALRLLRAKHPHFGHKAIAKLGHGLDIPLPIGAITQRLANERDVVGEVGLLNERPG